jgi:hypothetical protein
MNELSLLFLQLRIGSCCLCFGICGLCGSDLGENAMHSILEGNDGSVSQVVSVMDRNFGLIQSMSVDFDIYYKNTLYGSCRELFQDGRHLIYNLHWYENGLYPMKMNAQIDPLRNWILHSKDEWAQCNETTGQGVLASEKASGPRLDSPMFFAGRLGIVGRTVEFTREKSLEISIPTNNDFFLPRVFEKSGWVLIKNEDEEVFELRNDSSPVSDWIKIDSSRGFAITERKIFSEDRSINMHFRYSDFREVIDSFWLPRVIEEVSSDELTIFVARCLDVNNDLSDAIKPSWPSGAIVHDTRTDRKYVVVGEDDGFLDLTVIRAQETIRANFDFDRSPIWIVTLNGISAVTVVFAIYRTRKFWKSKRDIPGKDGS